MKRKVVITVEVDPTEYNGAIDSDDGAVELVRDMLDQEADLPRESLVIQCGTSTGTMNISTI